MYRSVRVTSLVTQLSRVKAVNYHCLVHLDKKNFAPAFHLPSTGLNITTDTKQKESQVLSTYHESTNFIPNYSISGETFLRSLHLSGLTRSHHHTFTRYGGFSTNRNFAALTTNIHNGTFFKTHKFDQSKQQVLNSNRSASTDKFLSQSSTIKSIKSACIENYTTFFHTNSYCHNPLLRGDTSYSSSHCNPSLCLKYYTTSANDRQKYDQSKSTESDEINQKTDHTKPITESDDINQKYDQTKSTESEETNTDETNLETEKPEPEPDLSLYQKFKQAYKEQGKVLVAVHVVTSVVWFSSFYAIAVYGIDISPILRFVGISESIITKIVTSPAGYAATAYLIYKICTPLRYMVTLGGTRLTIQQLRKTGYMDPVPHGSKLKDFYQDGKVIMKEKKENLKDKTDSMKDNLKDRTDSLKDNLKDRTDSLKDNLKDRTDSMKDNLKDRTDSLKDRLKDKTKR